MYTRIYIYIYTYTYIYLYICSPMEDHCVHVSYSNLEIPCVEPMVTLEICRLLRKFQPHGATTVFFVHTISCSVPRHDFVGNVKVLYNSPFFFVSKICLLAKSRKLDAALKGSSMEHPRDPEWPLLTPRPFPTTPIFFHLYTYIYIYIRIYIYIYIYV